jgi:hypothetical protein
MDNPLSAFYEPFIQLRQVTIGGGRGLFCILLGWLFSRDLRNSSKWLPVRDHPGTGQTLECLTRRGNAEILQLYRAFNIL